ncbi:MAG TPA: sugar-binding protein, partial [Phycisphaerae bacterium]|nr:sugar-binding protein [Phycisphaerae bacterium]
WSKDVPRPAAVRYAFSEGSPNTLYNREGLPASPFRTDDWSWDLPTKAPRTARCIRAKAPPEIDGKLADPVWRIAEVQSDFTIRHTYRGSAHPTEVRFAYDDEHLYAALRCADARPGGPIATGEKRDDVKILDGDTVELFVDTNLDRKTYHRLVLNPAGLVLDGRGYNDSADGPRHLEQEMLYNGRWFLADWNADCEVKTGKVRGGWTVEVAVPWKSLGTAAPKAGGKVGLQVIRNCAAGLYKDPGEGLLRNERSQWISTGRDYNTGAMMPHDKMVHSPMRFGVLAFE